MLINRVCIKTRFFWPSPFGFQGSCSNPLIVPHSVPFSVSKVFTDKLQALNGRAADTDRKFFTHT